MRKEMKNKLYILGIILTAIFLTACGNSDNNVMDKINPKVTFEPVSNAFYYDQLNEEEIQVLENVMEKCQTFKGGLIELEEPISFHSYLRIIYTIYYDETYRFWPLVMLYPYDVEGRLADEESDEKIISKIYVQLTEATENELLQELQIEYSEDGVIRNEEELISVVENTTFTEEYYRKTSEQIEEMEQEIISGMSADVRQKEAVFYFCNWIKDNMEYDFEVMALQEDLEEDTVPYARLIYANASYEQSILRKKALCGGFAIILSDLCNQVGIPSYVVIGEIDVNGQKVQHGWVAVEIGEQTLYIDPTFVSSMKRMDSLSTKSQMESRRSDGRCYIFNENFEY